MASISALPATAADGEAAKTNGSSRLAPCQTGTEVSEVWTAV